MADNNIVGAELTMSLDAAKILVMRGLAGLAPRVNPSNDHWEVYDNDTQQWVDTNVIANGRSPYIDNDGYWVFFDDIQQQWYTTNVKAQGPQGEEGFSPSVVVSSINLGHRVTITDADGQHSFDVLNGSNGSDGYSPTVAVSDITDGHKVTITDRNGNHEFNVMDGEDGFNSVLRVNYYAAASGTHAQGDLTIVSGSTETAVTGAELANAVANGYYPVVIEAGVSYPRIYKPEVVLLNTMITFRSTDMNGSVSVLNVLWNASTATQFSVIGDMPTPNVPQDVGKVVTVNSSGGYTLQAPSEGGLTDEAKQALLACFANVAWINDDGQTYYDALETALYPPANLVSISAVFNQGSAVIYDTDSLDTLKQYLTVTAHYDNSTTQTVTNYTLSGTLTVGTSTITVSYGGKTTTFTVVVSHQANGLVDGTYNVQNVNEIVVNNNSLTFTIKQGWKTFDIPFKAPIVLHSGDVVRFNVVGDGGEATNNNVYFGFNGTRYAETSPWRSAPYGATVTMEEDVTATTLYVYEGVKGRTCTLSLTVNGEVIF